MKGKVILLTALSFILFTNAQSQENASKDYIWNFKGKNKTHEVGLYGEISTKYSTINSKTAGALGAKAALVFNDKFSIGWAGYGIWFDYRLDELVSNGTYHLESGYQGLFVEHLQPLGDNLKLGISLLSGKGIAFYKYDHDYAEDYVWYEEIIDADDYAVLEPGIEIQAKIGKRWWLGANATYRTTSPLKMTGTDENMLENYTFGIAFKYGIYYY